MYLNFVYALANTDTLKCTWERKLYLQILNAWADRNQFNKNHFYLHETWTDIKKQKKKKWKKWTFEFYVNIYIESKNEKKNRSNGKVVLKIAGVWLVSIFQYKYKICFFVSSSLICMFVKWKFTLLNWISWSVWRASTTRNCNLAQEYTKVLQSDNEIQC